MSSFSRWQWNSNSFLLDFSPINASYKNNKVKISWIEVELKHKSEERNIDCSSEHSLEVFGSLFADAWPQFETPPTRFVHCQSLQHSGTQQCYRVFHRGTVVTLGGRAGPEEVGNCTLQTLSDGWGPSRVDGVPLLVCFLLKNPTPIEYTKSMCNYFHKIWICLYRRPIVFPVNVGVVGFARGVVFSVFPRISLCNNNSNLKLTGLHFT